MRDGRDLAGPLGVIVAERMAGALVLAFDRTEEEGYPLNQLQKIDLLTCMFQCFDGMLNDFEANLEGESFIAGARRDLERLLGGGDGLSDGEAVDEDIQI